MTLQESCEKIITYNDDDDLSNAIEEPSDYLWDPAQVIPFVLNGTSIECSSSGVTVKGSVATITSAGTYSFEGTLTDGQIVVNSGDTGTVRLLFQGVSINCSSGAPVYVQKAAKAVIILIDETTNKLVDGSTYSHDGEPNATIFSNSYLSFSGGGSLTVEANYNDAVSSDDGVVINSGTFDITAADDGIRGKDFVVIHDGGIAINSQGDGIKSDNTEDEEKGFIRVDSVQLNISAQNGDGFDAENTVRISNGNISITTGGGPTSNTTGYSGTVSKKGIKAASDITVTGGVITLNTADDAFHTETNTSFSSAECVISTGDDAVHSEESIKVDGASVIVKKCYEGFESSSITVDEGYISIISSDDAFNGTKGMKTEANDGSCIYINGGTTVLNPSSGDGLDSNGNVIMTGGTVIVHGPRSAPEVGIDVNGSCTVSGGFFIATGPNAGNMIEGVSSGTQQNSLMIKISAGLTAGSLIRIQDGDGDNIVTYRAVRNLYYIVFSSADLKTGSAYQIYTGGTSTGTISDGIISDGVYTGGTLRKSFSISQKITSLSI